ncbi:MAG: sodium/proline symporter, partial [Oscillospiraceae bacterium]|nr:sodium/proline symporter [Oscillospiraceae bacterium]
MSGSTLQIIIAMAIYLLVVVVIGLVFAKRANESSENFFLGGRGLGPWVAAMSAEASDMSGWLLMGLPGVAFFWGAADAAWTAIGLFAGTYINWLVVAKPLRRYSTISGSITIPEFFSNRFKEVKSKPLLSIASLMILIFFAVYTGSCFVTGGKLFAQLFGAPYLPMMLLGAVIVIFYTLLGGFLAESTSDFIQGIVMVIALLAVLGAGVLAAGGVGRVVENDKGIPGFLTFFGMASPTLDADGVQQTANGAALFNPISPIITGVMMAGILAAVMSSSDSYLLIASSALSKNIYQGMIKKNADDREVMLVSRLALLAVAIAGVIIALNQNSKIFSVVSFAWAGFGAAFGPLVLFSLFWKRTSHAGAIAGVLAG